MVINIPIRKTDNESAVIGRDLVFNAPIKSEKRIYFEDFRGIINDPDNYKTVIDDRKNPYDKTKPVLVEIIKRLPNDHDDLVD